MAPLLNVIFNGLGNSGSGLYLLGELMDLRYDTFLEIRTISNRKYRLLCFEIFAKWVELSRYRLSGIVAYDVKFRFAGALLSGGGFLQEKSWVLCELENGDLPSTITYNIFISVWDINHFRFVSRLSLF